jgi:hypothetical protein
MHLTFLHPISTQGAVSLVLSDLYGLTEARCDQWTYKCFKQFICNIEKRTEWGRMKSIVGCYRVQQLLCQVGLPTASYGLRK